MKIAFLDPSLRDYNVETPIRVPLGGTQSAVSYLAAELTRLGHQISLINHIAATGDYAGVRCLRWAEGMNSGFLNRHDVVIAVNTGNAGVKFREFGIRAPLVLWTHHRFDQPAVQRLRHRSEHEAWTGIAFVSRWAGAHYLRWFGVPVERCRVLHNGIGQPFAEQETAVPWFLGNSPPVLAYTSMPNRGLDVLLDAFPAIRAAIPDVQLRVYSGLSLYHVEPGQDRFEPLYERARRTEGVQYSEPVGQGVLARELGGAAALAYPCTVPESFCLVAAEAMALGATLIMTRLGAPAELFRRFASMVNLGTDRKALVETYGRLVIETLVTAKRNPEAAQVIRNAQIEFIRTNYTWPRIAPQWIAWLEALIGGRNDRSNLS